MSVKRWASLLLVLGALHAFAQPVVPERELEAVKLNFTIGNFKEALARARAAMEVSNFNETQRVELHKYAGVSAFNLGDSPAAEKHFFSLLQLNPDYALDPFAVPPGAIKLFEDVKRKNADALNLIRQQIALREEQLRRENAERERQRIATEEARRRLEELSRSVTVRNVEKRSFLVNFIPFGAGQFQQGRTAWGVAFATVEGVLAITSVISYFALEALFENVTYNFDNRIYPDDGRFAVTVRQIPATRANEANVWRTLKLSTGIGFYVVWAGGIVDALLHHQDEVVTTETRRMDEALPAGVKALIPAAPVPGPSLNLFPTPGGIGAGLTIHFQ